MTKQELNDCLFSLNIAYGYLKTYGLKDYDRDHVLTHLRLATETVERDRVTKAEDNLT